MSAGVRRVLHNQNLEAPVLLERVVSSKSLRRRVRSTPASFTLANLFAVRYRWI